MQTSLTPTKPPFSLILSGGGMRCAWTGGFLVGMRELGLVPSVIVTHSGNVGNAVYFASDQTEVIKRTWCDHLTGNRFINYMRLKKIVDIDFLFDEVLSSKEPLNIKALQSSQVQVFIACYNVTQQVTEYFSNNDIDHSVLKASASIPVLYGKKTLIKGSKYADRPFTPNQFIDDHIENLQGKILVVDTSERTLFFELFCKIYNRKGYLRSKRVSGKNIYEIHPKDVGVHLLTRSKSKIENAFEQGALYARSNNQLKSFLSSLSVPILGTEHVMFGSWAMEGSNLT